MRGDDEDSGSNYKASGGRCEPYLRVVDGGGQGRRATTTNRNWGELS